MVGHKIIKLLASIAFGLLICLGHWLARGTLILADQVGHETSVEIRTAAVEESEPPQTNNEGSDPASGVEDRSWRDLIALPLPKNFWEQLGLFALLVSVFSATVLNSYFPDEYRDLGRSETRTALVQSVIPALQVLSVAVACATVETMEVHCGATGLYLGLFLVWDLVILAAKNPGDQGRNFQERVRTYMWRFDLPVVFAFGALYLVAQRGAPASEEGYVETFVAGVLCAQAASAVFAACVVVAEDFRAGTEKPERDQPLPTTEEERIGEPQREDIPTGEPDTGMSSGDV